MLFGAIAFVLVSASADTGSPPAARTAQEVVAVMMARDAERTAALHGYTATRKYVLESPGRHRRAEMLVRLTCSDDGSKQFEIESSDGWSAVLKHVFPRLLEAETEAARPGARDRSRIIPQNYTFEMVDTEYVRGRLAYVLSIEPKTENKYLTRGRIWIDAEDYAIVRVEGRPARNPSFWLRSVHFTHDYEKEGDFWLPALDKSVNDVRMAGATEMTIESFDYKVK